MNPEVDEIRKNAINEVMKVLIKAHK
jgi:hypothetical protein